MCHPYRYAKSYSTLFLVTFVSDVFEGKRLFDRGCSGELEAQGCNNEDVSNHTTTKQNCLIACNSFILECNDLPLFGTTL